MVEPWFSGETAGLIGGGLGAGIGVVFGGILGPLVGIYAPRGELKPLVVGMLSFGIGLGALLLSVGLAALLLGQPWHVWLSFAHSGLLLVVLLGFLTPVILGRYRQADQRRIAAEELRRA